MRNATYISPQTQIQIIDIIGIHLIQKKIMKFYKPTFMLLWWMKLHLITKSLCLCAYALQTKIRTLGKSLYNLTLICVTGEAIATQICSDLASLGLDVKDIRGQGYDSALNMSSALNHVQAHIKEQSPLATYTHCSGHCLNLVISHSCNLPAKNENDLLILFAQPNTK